MSWTWDSIQRDWLKGGLIAETPETIVEAFNEAECVLGADWVSSKSALPAGHVTGPLPTLGVVSIGKELLSLRGVRNAESLVAKLRGNEESAFAELLAVHVLRSGNREIEAEYLTQQIGNAGRVPDLRLRFHHGLWIYVEVTKPDISEVQDRLQSIMSRITQSVVAIRQSFALEVYLRREPTELEMEMLIRKIPDFCTQSGIVREEIENLGLLLLNLTPPTQFVIQHHPGEENRPAIGMLRGIGGATEPPRHIAVRIAYSDGRAEAFLRKEARQLPTEFPGLIIILTSNTVGASRSWAEVLRKRFQPGLHTRVGAVCLLESGIVGTERGESVEIHTKLLTNPHAKLALPSWLTDQLRRFEGDS